MLSQNDFLDLMAAHPAFAEEMRKLSQKRDRRMHKRKKSLLARRMSAIALDGKPRDQRSLSVFADEGTNDGRKLED